MQYLKYIIPVIAAVLGAFVKTIWDYYKLEITRKAEIEKMSVNIYFDLARNHYFGIYHFTTCLRRMIQDIHDQEVKDYSPEILEVIYKEAFYNISQYRRQIWKFTDEIGAVFFLTNTEHENEIVDLAKRITIIMPFDSIQLSFLASAGSTGDGKPIALHKFVELIDSDAEMRKLYLIFKEWVQCGCDELDKEQCEVIRLLGFLKAFVTVIESDLNLAFKDWYSLRRFKKSVALERRIE